MQLNSICSIFPSNKIVAIITLIHSIFTRYNAPGVEHEGVPTRFSPNNNSSNLDDIWL